MSDNPVKWTAAGLTPAGNALQAALLGTGDGLTFTRAAAADAEGVERLDLTLQSPCTVDGPKCRVPVLLTNAGVETAFTMTELRFYVRRVTDGAPTGEEILYATVTDETGDPIPTAAQSPGFTIDWAFVFQYGNAGSVTVTLDPVGLVSIGMVGRPGGVAALGDNGAVPVSQGGTGATTAQAALAKLGAGVRPSLVDNGIFVGENLPINQDGKTSWTAYERTVDRWFKEQSGTCSLDVDGFHVSASACVIQTIPDYSFLLGKTITVSILLSDGRYASVTGMCPTASGTDFNILASIEKLRYGIQIFTEYSNYQIGRIDNLENDADVIVVGVKTEEGPNQTLYYVGDDGKGHLLPQNDADYATQLLKCQQYYWDYGPESGGAIIVLACTIAGNGKEFNFLIPTSTKMYTPIHFAFESLTVSDLEGNYYAFSKDDFSVMSINSGSSGVAVRFRVTANTGLADGFGVFFGSGLFLEGGA